MMFGCKCFHRSRVPNLLPTETDTFSLPDPIPKWPQGKGFATGRISLGEIEVVEITKFEFIWEYNFRQEKKKGVTFYKPVGIPNGFFRLGDYCQSNDHSLRGFVLAAREVTSPEAKNSCTWDQDKPRALSKPLDYTLVWSSNDGSEENFVGCGFIWLPKSPEGYKALGFVVTNKPDKPELEEFRCVRADLTGKCETYHLMLDAIDKFPELSFRVWTTRPSDRGLDGKGVSVGTFFCTSYWSSKEELPSCLKNLSPTLQAMPNLDQSHALIRHYGPTIFFHPDEDYLPSSISWFFKNGALLFRSGESLGEAIDAGGSNLPGGGSNDGAYWIDLPSDHDRRERLKKGDLKSAVLYVHLKPAFGGTFTDIATWVFCPFNGPAILKVGVMNVALSKIGQHVCDWEHFTLRISNFTGELWSVYFSQHSGGKWVDASDLEFIEGNKAIVYSSKHGHASFPHRGSYIQGSGKLGIGVRNDAARSNYYVDSSTRYEIVAAEYLGEGIVSEPCWLQYMRKWGPTVVYGSRTELGKIINLLPLALQNSVENVFDKLPVELYGENGPTGPKEKNNWEDMILEFNTTTQHNPRSPQSLRVWAEEGLETDLTFSNMHKVATLIKPLKQWSPYTDNRGAKGTFCCGIMPTNQSQKASERTDPDSQITFGIRMAKSLAKLSESEVGEVEDIVSSRIASELRTDSL